MKSPFLATLILNFVFVVSANADNKASANIIANNISQPRAEERITEAMQTLRSTKVKLREPESLQEVYNNLVKTVLADPILADSPHSEKLFEMILQKKIANSALALQVLSLPEWSKKPTAVSLAERLVLDRGPGAISFIQTVLTQELWVNERGAELIRFAIGRKADDPTKRYEYLDEVVFETLKNPLWQKYPLYLLEFTEMLLLTKVINPQNLLTLLKSPALSHHPLTRKLLDEYQDLFAESDQASTPSIYHRALRWFRIKVVME